MGRVIYIDRSRVETRQACPRQRFWNYDWISPEEINKRGGIEAALANVVGGITRTSGSLPLLNGIAIHAAHARLLAGQTIDEVIALATKEYTEEVTAKGVFGEADTPALIKEQLAMLEGMVRLWAMWRLPAILEEYELAQFRNGEIVPHAVCGPEPWGCDPAIELAWEWEMAPGLVQRLRMDAILRRKGDGMLHILDYKSTKYVSDVWRDKFEHSLQTELYVQALKEKTGEPVGGMLYEGLIKGAWRKDTAKSSPFYEQRIQSSPYCYAYRLEGADETVWVTDYTAKKGFQKVRITDVMTTKEWVEEHLQHLVQPSEMFVSVPPICPPPFELERIKKQVVDQELRYHESLAEYRRLQASGQEEEASELLDLFAPQHASHCVQYGQENKCQFLGICWDQGSEPLQEGGFEVRRPHHEGEAA